MKERLQLDLQDMKAKLEVVDSDSRLRVEQELAGLGRRMVDYQTDSRSAAASLILRIQALEAQNAKVTPLVEMYTTDTQDFCKERQSHSLMFCSCYL